MEAIRGSNQDLGPADAGERTAVDDASEFLRDALRSGPVKAKDVVRAARAAGISERSLDRAKAELGVRSRKLDFSGAWAWLLPEDGHTPELAPFTPVDLPDSLEPTEATVDSADVEGCHGEGCPTPLALLPEHSPSCAERR